METFNVSEPPKLVREEFAMWKQRMKDFLVILDAALWRSIRDGPYVPMTISADPGIFIPKNPSDYSDEDMKRMNVDRQAHAVLTMALSDEIYRGLFHCKSAKELWDCLCEQYEETPDVQAERAELLVQQYELFGYISGESMTQQFERFVSLVSELQFRGIVYGNERLVRKFMRSLPSHWRTYTAIIKDSKDLTTMTLTQLHGYLETYELELKQDKKIQVEQALVSDWSLTVEDLEQFDPDYVEEIDLQYQMVMLNLRIKRFTKRTGKSINGNPQGMVLGFDKSKARCCNCQKTGHFARECKSPKPAQSPIASR